MESSVKIDLEKIIRDGSPLIIELGCGQKSKQGRITVDKVDLPSVDIVADIENGLAFLPDDTVDEIHCRSVLEHIQNFEDLMREIEFSKKAAKHMFLCLIFPIHFITRTIHTKGFLAYILFIIL